MTEPATKPRALPTSFGDMKVLPLKIPVSFVKLTKPMDIPGDSVIERIKCVPVATNQKCWVVNYITALDSFEIFYHPADQREPVQVAMLHVSSAQQWWPIL